MQKSNTATKQRLLDIEQLVEAIPVTQATLLSWVNVGLFPLPCEHSPRGAAMWDREDIVKWSETRKGRLRKYICNV